MDALDIGWRSALLMSLTAPTLIAAIIIGIRATERPAFVWLAVLLGAWCWYSVPYIVGFAGAYTAFPWLSFAPFNVELWFGPLLYLHAVTLSNQRRPRRQWLWLAPGIVQFGYYTGCFLLLGDGPSKFAFDKAVHRPYIMPIETLAGIGLAVVGIVLALQESRRYRQWLLRAHSAADAFDPVWLRRFVGAMAITVAAWVAIDTWDGLVSPLHYVEIFWMYFAIGVIFLLLALDGLTHVDTVFPKIPASQPSTATPVESGVSAEVVAARVREAGLYEDPNLSLAALARHMGTNEHYLSRAINAGSGVNFNRFINEIRVEKVCERLRDPECDESLLQVAMSAGFASKATFNRAFRSLTGETPGQWRRKAREGIKS